MIKVSNLYLPSRLFAIVLVDGILLTAAVFFSLPGLTTAKAELASVFASIVFLACFYLFDLYDLDATRRAGDVLLRSLRALGTGFLLLMPVWAAFVIFRPSYRILEINLILFVAILCAYRTASEWLHHWVFPGKKLLLVGSDPSIDLLASALTQKLSLPLKLSAIIPERAAERTGEQSFAMCEDITKIPAVMSTFRASHVAIAASIVPQSPLTDELLDLRRQGVRYRGRHISLRDHYRTHSRRVAEREAFDFWTGPCLFKIIGNTAACLWMCRRLPCSFPLRPRFFGDCNPYQAGFTRACFLQTGTHRAQRKQFLRPQVSFHAPGCGDLFGARLGFRLRQSSNACGTVAPDSAAR